MTADLYAVLASMALPAACGSGPTEQAVRPAAPAQSAIAPQAAAAPPATGDITVDKVSDPDPCGRAHLGHLRL